jgi:cytochrome c556
MELRLAACVIALTSATVAFAQEVETIKARREILKTMGKATKEPAAMLKGEAAFDLAKVQSALKTYQEQAPKLVGMFPDTAKTGGETEALPAIWENKQDFEGRYPKLAADAKAAEGTIKDEASFKEQFPKVVANCGGCHKLYREKK